MKLFISIHEGNSNRFDYKVTFFLDQGFELLTCNYIVDERNKISFASFIKEIKDGSDIEVERRLLMKKVNEWLGNQQYDKFLIDIQTGKGYKQLDDNQQDEFFQENRVKIKEFEERYYQFLMSNQTYMSLIKPEKQKYYANISHILKYDDVAARRIIDEDKIDEFNKIKEQAIELNDYGSNNLINIVSF